MTGLYRLLNMETWRMFKGAGIISVVMVALQCLFMDAEVRKLHEFAEVPRFEDVFLSAGGAIMFWISLIAVFVWFTISFYAHYWGSKSIYTLLTLPVSRTSLYMAQLVSLMIGIAVVLSAQLLSVLLAFSMYESRLESFEQPMMMANGLFLAFIRSGFLRLLFPLTLEGVLHSTILWVSMAITLYFAILCERAQKRWFVIPVVFLGRSLIKLATIRMADPIRLPYESMTSYTWYSLILLLISGLFIWLSLRWIRKGAIA